MTVALSGNENKRKLIKDFISSAQIIITLWTAILDIKLHSRFFSNLSKYPDLTFVHLYPSVVQVY